MIIAACTAAMIFFSHSSMAQPSVVKAVQTFNAAANEPAKVRALCTLFEDMEKLANKPPVSKGTSSGEQAMTAILAKLPGDLRSAVEAEYDLPAKDRGNDKHPYYKAMEKMTAGCPK